MICNNQFYLCLECGKEFENNLKIAICPECLENERKNFEKGITSKYQTVMMHLRKKSFNNLKTLK